MTFTTEDVRVAIEENESEEDYYGSGAEWYSNLDWEARNGKTVPLTVAGTEYQVKYVDSYGGMDQGTELWVVFEIDGRLFKKHGAYYSHDGSYWDGSLDEVRPVQKTITVFE